MQKINSIIHERTHRQRQRLEPFRRRPVGSNPSGAGIGNYALIMPARNEEHVIRYSIESIIRQTCRPMALVIALNDCTDNTAGVVEPYLRQYPWISVYKHDYHGNRNFGNKARIFSEAFARISHLNPGYVGNLDADVSLPRDFYQRMIVQFDRDPQLGIAGGTFFEVRNGQETPHFDSHESNVGGVVQFFRRECYKDIGGYRQVASGGVDMVANILARFHGWKTRSFPELRFQHHRQLGTAESGILRAKFREGVRDYHLGYGFVFHCFKCLRRLPETPCALGSLARFTAYILEAAHDDTVVLDTAELKYFRAEQWERIFGVARNLGSRIRRRVFG